MAELPLADKVLALHQALDTGKIPHAFGGAIALGYYAEPRVTVDIDVNLFVPVSAASEVASSLAPLGVPWDAATDTLERDGQCRLRWGRNPIDLFFEYDEVHRAFAQGSRTVPFQTATIPVLAPEHLMVCKVVFDRAKDWLDLEQMVTYLEYVDPDEVRRWLGHIVGTDDPRYLRAEELLAQREPSTEPNGPIDWRQLPR